MKGKLQPPIFVINCKTYLEVTGRKAVELAKIADEVSEEKEVSLLFIPQLTDITAVSKVVGNVSVFAPHIDPIMPGPHTGHVLAEALKEAGAIGTMINHAEHRLLLNDVRVAIERTKRVGLISVVCANTPLEAKAIAILKPDMMIVEPPELIGTGKAVSKVMRNYTSEAVKAVKSVDPSILVIVGAGITSPEDVEEVISMGADGTGGTKFILDVKDKKKLLLQMTKAAKRAWDTRTKHAFQS